VVLPLLAHLDRTGRTVRLPDDTRRVVARSSSPAP
jgi:selenocysteine-specific elongation factor